MRVPKRIELNVNELSDILRSYFHTTGSVFIENVSTLNGRHKVGPGGVCSIVVEIWQKAGEQETDSPNLGARIRALRKSRGVSFEDLAAAADMTPEYLERLELGRAIRNPSAGIIDRIAKRLGCTVCELRHGTPEEE